MCKAEVLGAIVWSLKFSHVTCFLYNHSLLPDLSPQTFNSPQISFQPLQAGARKIFSALHLAPSRGLRGADTSLNRSQPLPLPYQGCVPTRSLLEGSPTPAAQLPLFMSDLSLEIVSTEPFPRSLSGQTLSVWCHSTLLADCHSAFM